MAQPVNTISTYDMRNIREDLEDIIYDVSPTATPFMTRCAKVKASNTLHEWQTDTLAPAGDNAHIEGDDTIAEVRSPTTRLGNRTQIFKKAPRVTGTEAYTSKAGANSEMARQITKMMKEIKLDIEAALFANNASSGGSDTSPRRLAGVPAWLTTNVRNVGSGGSNPTGDGTNARVDGAQSAFGQTNFDLAMQSIWSEGGEPDTVYLNAFQMNAAQAFVGNNNQRSNVDAEDNTVYRYMGVYATSWGTVTFVPSRHVRPRDVWIMQSDMWKIATLRPMVRKSLPSLGDSEASQIITELTLVCANQRASGGVVDCTTA